MKQPKLSSPSVAAGARCRRFQAETSRRPRPFPPSSPAPRLGPACACAEFKSGTVLLLRQISDQERGASRVNKFGAAMLLLLLAGNILQLQGFLLGRSKSMAIDAFCAFSVPLRPARHGVEVSQFGGPAPAAARPKHGHRPRNAFANSAPPATQTN
jgi:hypothetical protein